MLPPRTLLAPVDFSDASRASLRCAARLAQRWTASLRVVHVLDPLLAAAAQARRIDLDGSTREELQAFCRSAVLDAGVTPAIEVAVGPPAETICNLASTRGADLIVVGARGLSGLDRLLMGSTTERVIRLARTSVLTVPGRLPGDDVMAWGPVIAALADPGRPEPVVPAAAALAVSLGASLEVVHVVAPLPAPGRWRAEAESVQRARIDEARRTLAAALHGAGDIEPGNVRVVGGAVADTLAAEASRHTKSLALLIMGRAAPGRGPAPGTVASRVIARATAPVMEYLPDESS
jgi:nucleotide-binding universal stress UspA family protein